VELERIADEARQTEEDLWKRFEREHPSLLGGAFDVLSKAIALKPSTKLSRRPRLADWGEYSAALYDVMGWGAETFLKDWDEVVQVQNQTTLDGSPVAQAIIKFMENKEEYIATSSELHKILEGVAESLGVSIKHDKAWPKSARWLWRRIKEVQPLLVAIGIEANHGQNKNASTISLLKRPTYDPANSTIGETGMDKPKISGDKAEPVATANATTDEPNANIDNTDTANTISNPTRKADSYADFGGGGNSGNSYEDSWEEVSEVVQALQDLFEIRPETRKLEPERLIDDLYIWTNLGYEPPISVVIKALQVVT
jgi:hypothetical protein